MKPEIGYDSIVIGSYINDLLDGIEWNMRHTDLKDPYFEQLSVEKFTLETLLQEIAKHGDIGMPTEILEQFVQKADECVTKSHDQHNILDGLYFGYLEGEERSGFQETPDSVE